jgi:ABC-type antimicrobial peptide transport system permease subunit
MSRFALDCSSISFEVINESKKAIINKINSRDSPYSFLIANDPMENFSLGVDEVCSFLEIALLFFSSITIVVSILLLSMSNYLFLLENKKQIGLLRCIGISSFEARKLLICNSLIYGTLAFIISSFELLLTSIFINLETSIILGGELFISFNPISLLVIFIISISISLVSSVLISSKLASFSPLESLKS